jgi:hypothetical protein
MNQDLGDLELTLRDAKQTRERIGITHISNMARIGQDLGGKSQRNIPQ